MGHVPALKAWNGEVRVAGSGMPDQVAAEAGQELDPFAQMSRKETGRH
jgi:hypothetical protein